MTQLLRQVRFFIAGLSNTGIIIITFENGNVRSNGNAEQHESRIGKKLDPILEHSQRIKRSSNMKYYRQDVLNYCSRFIFISVDVNKVSIGKLSRDFITMPLTLLNVLSVLMKKQTFTVSFEYISSLMDTIRY